jgi:hypothetical protein
MRFAFPAYGFLTVNLYHFDAVAHGSNTDLRPLRKCFNNQKVFFIDQYIVEQAPSPAKYSRGRLF